MYEKPIERVRKIIKYSGLSVSAFEKRTGMSNNSIQAALKRGTSLKDETLNNILKAFPEISAEWLLTGHGAMIVEENQIHEPDKPYPDPNDTYVIELQREYITKLKEEIAELKGHRKNGATEE